MDNKYTFDEIVAHLKSSGFVYQGSEIYGGLSNSWDFGVLGSWLKKNIKDLWWQESSRSLRTTSVSIQRSS